MILEILNSEEFHIWLDKRFDHRLVSILGSPPKGATYDGKEPIKNKINIA